MSKPKKPPAVRAESERTSTTFEWRGSTFTIPVSQDGMERWSRSDLLLADLWRAFTGSKKSHPMLARDRARVEAKRRDTPERRRRIEEAKRRRDERQRAIDAGEIR